MKTITFYSYKGGVGRTLLLANVAKYLASFEQKVFTLDFDLEAPGLHHKFGLNEKNGKFEIKQGIVDYIHSALFEEKKIDSLKPYVLEIEKRSVKGNIHLMPAGKVVSATYWQRLSQINWHELFYSEQPQGVPFFLDLKARIQNEFAPDYLLIDARTGITEIGGVATTILPEYVVCLLLSNRENLEGAREVLRSINRTTLIRKQQSIDIIPVLTRLPVKEASEQEKTIVEKVKNFLNEESSNLVDTLSISEISILHTDRNIELEESILIESNKNIESTPLLRDYIRLIARIVPREVIEPNIGALVNEALLNAWDDPDKAERDLIFLAERSVRPEPIKALLKFYRLRSVSKDKLLRVAWKYWQLTYDSNEPILWEVIRENFDWENVKSAFGVKGYRLVKSEQPNTEPDIDIDFVYRVWKSIGHEDYEMGIQIAKAYLALKNPEKSINIIQILKNSKFTTEDNLLDFLDITIQGNAIEIGFEIIKPFRDIYISSEKFLYKWMQLVVKSNDEERAQNLLRYIADTSLLFSINFELASEILTMAERSEELKLRAKDWLLDRMSKGDFSHGGLVDIGLEFRRKGLFFEFQNIVTSHLLPSTAQEILEEISERYG